MADELAEELVYEGIPGATNLARAKKLLEEHDIPSRGVMTGMSFQNLPPISMNNLWVEAQHLTQASELLQELSANGWVVSQQKIGGGEQDDHRTPGGDQDHQ